MTVSKYKCRLHPNKFPLSADTHALCGAAHLKALDFKENREEEGLFLTQPL